MSVKEKESLNGAHKGVGAALPGKKSELTENFFVVVLYFRAENELIA